MMQINAKASCVYEPLECKTEFFNPEQTIYEFDRYNDMKLYVFVVSHKCKLQKVSHNERLRKQWNPIFLPRRNIPILVLNKIERLLKFMYVNT
jgi:hypothetical protein